MSAMNHNAFHPAATRRELFGWLAGGAALATLGLPRDAVAQAATRFPLLKAYIDGYVSSGRLPGAIAAIGIGNSPLESVAAGTIAVGSSTTADLDSIWRLYSMTKPVTGMATMQLIEQGRFALDTPLYDILPAFRTMRVLTAPGAAIDSTVAATRPITIRNLLTHTAGLGYTIVQPPSPIRTAYTEQGIIPGQVSRTPFPGLDRGTPAPSLAAFADRLATLPLVYQPGSKWSYSVSLDLLGRVIEVVSGKPFDQYLQDNFFDPLGMTSTGFKVKPEWLPRFASNYAPIAGNLIPLDPAATSIYLDTPPFPTGGAGLVSSARDYDRFLAMVMNDGMHDGTRILSAETVRIGTSNILPAGADTTGSMAANTGFGAGGRVSLAGAAGGEGIYGWGGAAGTIAFVDRRRRIRFGGYANYMPSSAYDFQQRVAEVFSQELATMAAPA